MFKNVASQKLMIFAFDITTGAPKTGDAANLTAYVSKDYGAVTVLGDTSATEMDATNAKGWYLFDLTQAETNFDNGLFSGKSSTANISLVGQIVATLPASFTSFVTPPTAAVNAAAVWDLATAGHTTAGTFGKLESDTNAIVDTALDANSYSGGQTIIQALDAIKAKTTSLSFNVAGQVDANIQYVNDVQIKGVGTTLDPWNPV